MIRKYLVLLLLAVLCLSACAGAAADGSAPAADIGVGGQEPEQIVQSFFEDLGRALKDPALADASHRAALVEQLAGYFAPNERADQREALSAALGSYVTGLSKLGRDETIRFKLPDDSTTFRTIANDGQRALVHAANATLSMDVLRSTSNGQVNEYHQEEPLAKLIGRPDGTIPTVKVGAYWFLTEG